MRVFAVVGGIAAGKSTVCALMAARHGAVVIDADRVGHRALEGPAVRARLLQRFGTGLLGRDGRIDRRKLGKLVFSNVQHRHWLDALVHPEIGRRIRGRLRYRRLTGTSTVLVDAALYLEAALGFEADAVLAVTAPRAVRRQRLAARGGLQEAEVEARLNSQPRVGAWTRQADVVVDTRGKLEELGERVDRAWDALQRIARRSRASR